MQLKAYEKVIITASEVIKEYHGKELVNEEALVDFISKIRDKLLNAGLSANEVAEIGKVLMKKGPLSKFTGSSFLRLQELANDVKNIELVRNTLNTPIGIKEKK